MAGGACAKVRASWHQASRSGLTNKTMNLQIRVTGAVQGIGYRPFVAGKAEQLHIAGEVRNCGGVVEIYASASEVVLREFIDALTNEAPAGAIIISSDVRKINDDEDFPDHSGKFIIVGSTDDKDKAAENVLPVFPPDIAMCDDCRKEMENSNDRRYRYPLISCASCGPRWSILKRLPYDRETTTMDAFPMCNKCSAEYKVGRRRHAQTISCHDCGPQMILRFIDKSLEFNGDEAVEKAVSILNNGGIVAVKGVGGYQLVCSPFDSVTVRRLRLMKGREKKPFAIQFPNMTEIRKCCTVSTEEEKLFMSPARPIVLIELSESASVGKKSGFDESVSGDSRYLGAFLPSFGLQQMLTDECGPLIVTSANLSGEPIVTDDEKFADTALRLKPDAILYHKREILRPLDDSVLFVSDGAARMIRRSRGYVPLPVFLKRNSVKEIRSQSGTLSECNRTILATGGDLKAAFAIGRGDRVILSQYFGDLENYENMKNYMHAEKDMEHILNAHPDVVVCDMHPRYHSSDFAREYQETNSVKLVQFQHHHAHAASVMAEHGLNSAVGIIFDGTGYGTDRSLWGGEFLYCKGNRMERAGSLSPILLAGGDVASVDADMACECYRAAIGIEPADPVTRAALENRIGTIMSSSMGRFFDAIAAALDIRHRNGYEGECAIALENAAARAAVIKGIYDPAKQISCDDFADLLPAEINNSEKYIVKSPSDGRLLLDQRLLFKDMTEARRSGMTSDDCALVFHIVLSKLSADIAEKAAVKYEEKNIVLSGGVFANRILGSLIGRILRDRGFAVYFNEKVPGNDGGIALGQCFLAELI